MIKYKDTTLEDFFIDPITAVITNSNGEIQKTYIVRGRPYFKGHTVHQWQMHTNFGAQNMDIHHNKIFGISSRFLRPIFCPLKINTNN